MNLLKKGSLNWFLGGVALICDNGIAIPTLSNQNFALLNNLKDSDWGGAIFPASQIKNIGNSYSSKLINIEENVLKNVKFELKEKSELPKLHLSVDKKVSPLHLTLGSQEEKLGVKVKDVSGQIEVFEKVNAISGEMNKKFQDLKKKHLTSLARHQAKHLQNFQSVKQQVSKWALRNQGDKSLTTSLTQPQRESLQKVYELYSDLDSERSKLAKSLDAIAPEEKLYEAVSLKQASNDYKDVKKSLTAIRWYGSKIRVSQLATFGKPIVDNWGDWSSYHPYRHFFGSQEEFQKVISSINDMSREISRQRRQAQADRSFWGWRSAQNSINAQLRELNSALRNIDSTVEMKVAQTLLKKINQA